MFLQILIFGGIMALVLGTIHIISLRMSGKSRLGDQDLSVKQNKSIATFLTKEQIKDLLTHDRYFSKSEIQETDEGLLVRTGVSWKSWGETIQIVIVSSGEHQNIIEIKSKPALGTTLVDYGKNAKNISKIIELIESAV